MYLRSGVILVILSLACLAIGLFSETEKGSSTFTIVWGILGLILSIIYFVKCFSKKKEDSRILDDGVQYDGVIVDVFQNRVVYNKATLFSKRHYGMIYKVEYVDECGVKQFVLIDVGKLDWSFNLPDFQQKVKIRVLDGKAVIEEFID